MLFYNKSTGSEVLLSNGDVLHSQSILKQNYDIKKTFKLYSLDYRLRVRERSYDIFNTYANNILTILLIVSNVLIFSKRYYMVV